VKDPGVLKLMRRYLEAGLREGGVASARSEGRAQGSPLSPLLWNILLDDLDRELERRGHGFCRYAEDGNIYVQSDRTGQRVRQSITVFLEQRLKLKVNAAKSAVARPWEGKFLGYSMTWHKKAKLKIASQSRQRLAEKIRLAFRRGRGQSMQPVMERLNSVLRGWMAYFRLSEVKKVLEELDGWLRRKLRTLLWRQRKRVYRRALNRMKAGIDKDRAWKSATHGRGRWWNGGATHRNHAYPKKWFDRMGLVSLMDTHRRFQSVS
jgi:RNA-directed DNA polymerase